MVINKVGGLRGTSHKGECAIIASMSDATSTLLILGARGDLTKRLLLPGLGSLISSGRSIRVDLIGSSTTPVPEAEWRKIVTDAFASVKATGRRAKSIANASRYIPADVTKVDDLKELLAACKGTPAIYFALPPSITMKACEALEKIELPQGTILALEKPFGTNARSAAALNRRLLKLVPEERIFRVDHFLGLSTVLNLIGLRFANRVFEPLWNREAIESVEIVYDESLALEGRAGYYDHAGALRDMLQSHLLETLAVFAMEPPASIDATELRSVISQTLRATEVWNNDPVQASHRARYTGGTIDGKKIPSYVKEDGVDPANETETLAQVTFAINNARWAGVPFTLRSGKALDAPRKEIVVTFRPMAHVPEGFGGDRSTKRRDRFVIGLNPDNFELTVTMNGKEDPFLLDQTTLSAGLGASELPPYGEVLEGMLSGDPRLSIRGDVAERCWSIVDPVLRAWKAGKVPMEEYRAGSSGPAAWSKLPLAQAVPAKGEGK